MILKYTGHGSFTQHVMSNVRHVSVEYEALDSEDGKPLHIANVRFIKADGETGTIPCKSGFVFLMNDDGKTVDKF